jgi:hypothetical protein
MLVFKDRNMKNLFIVTESDLFALKRTVVDRTVPIKKMDNNEHIFIKNFVRGNHRMYEVK